MGGYSNCTAETQGNLREIARMAYGSGFFERKSGGAGRIGMWEIEGKKCVIKFNTHLSERLRSTGNQDKSEMVSGSNCLRQELLHIAKSARVSDDVMAQIRRRLGMNGEELPTTLLNRTDVAKVVSLIGGDAVWDEALGERGKRIEEYASTGSDTHFKTLKERHIKPAGNARQVAVTRGNLSDDRVSIVKACLNEILDSPGFRQDNKAIVREVIDDEMISAFTAAMRQEEGKGSCPKGMFSPANVKHRLETCVMFILSTYKGDSLPTDTPEHRKSDLQEACVLQMASGSVGLTLERLKKLGVSLYDVTGGGRVLFANLDALKLVEDALDGLEADPRTSALESRDKALRLCENIAWALEASLTACSNETNRKAALAAIASRFRNTDSIRVRLLESSDCSLRESNLGSRGVFWNVFTQIAGAERMANELRGMREKARKLVDGHDGLLDLLREDGKDDVLFSTQGDPCSTVDELFGENADDKMLDRLLFVKYRLAVLEVMAETAKPVLKDALARAGSKVIFEGTLKGTLEGLPKDLRPELQKVLESWISRTLESEGRIGSEADLRDFLNRHQAEFGTLAAGVTRLLSKFNAKGIVETAFEEWQGLVDKSVQRLMRIPGGENKGKVRTRLEQELTAATGTAGFVDMLGKLADPVERAKFRRAWLEADASVSRHLRTGGEPDFAQAVKRLVNGLVGKARQQEVFQVEQPDFAGVADVDGRILTAYPAGGGANVFEKMPPDLLTRCKGALDTMLDRIAQGKELTIGQAFKMFWEDLAGGDEFLLGLFDGKVRGDVSYGMQRAIIRQTFTDMALEYLKNADEAPERTAESDRILAFWRLADQAFVALMDRIPEPAAKAGAGDVEAELSEKRLEKLLNLGVADLVKTFCTENAGGCRLPEDFVKGLKNEVTGFFADRLMASKGQLSDKAHEQDLARKFLNSRYGKMVKVYADLVSRRQAVVERVTGGNAELLKQAGDEFDLQALLCLKGEWKELASGEVEDIIAASLLAKFGNRGVFDGGRIGNRKTAAGGDETLLDEQKEDRRIRMEKDIFMRRVPGYIADVWASAAGDVRMPDYFREEMTNDFEKLFAEAVRKDAQEAAKPGEKNQKADPFDLDKSASLPGLVKDYEKSCADRIREYAFLVPLRDAVVKTIASTDKGLAAKVGAEYDGELRQVLSPKNAGAKEVGDYKGRLIDFARILASRKSVVDRVTDENTDQVAQVEAEFDRLALEYLKGGNVSREACERDLVNQLVARFGSVNAYLRHLVPGLEFRDISLRQKKVASAVSESKMDELSKTRVARSNAVRLHLNCGFIGPCEGSLQPAEAKMVELVRLHVMRALSEDGAKKTEIEGKLKAMQAANKAAAEAEELTEEIVDNLIQANLALAEPLEKLAREAHEASLATAQGMIGKEDLRLVQLLVGSDSLDVRTMGKRVHDLEMTVQQASKLPDENLKALGRLADKNFAYHNVWQEQILNEAKEGLLPYQVLTKETLSLVGQLLILCGHKIKIPKSDYLRGLHTLSGLEIVRVLVANGFDKVANGMVGAREDRFLTMAKAIALLHSVNGGPTGLDRMCQRVFGKPIGEVTDADLKKACAIIDKPADPKHPFANVDPIRRLKGVAGELASYLMSAGLASSLSFARSDVNALPGLHTALKAMRETGGPQLVKLGGVPLKLSVDARGRLVFTLEAEQGKPLTAVSEQSVTRLLDDLSRTLVADAKTYGAKTVETVLPPAKKLSYDSAARDVCVTYLREASGLPTIRFANVPTSDLVELAHEVLKTDGPRDDVRKSVEDWLGKKPGIGFATAETRELCEQLELLEMTDPETVRSQVVISKEASARTDSPLRAFAADLFMREDFWRDDGNQGVARLRKLLLDNVSLVQGLMKDDKGFDAFMIGPAGWKGGDALVRVLRKAVEGIRGIVGAGGNGVPTEAAIQQALNDSPDADKVLKAAAAEIAAVGSSLVEYAQKTFADVFVGALEQTQAEITDKDLGHLSLRVLAGVGTINVKEGFGKFLGTALRTYFSNATGADRSAILRSLVGNTQPGATPVDIMSALVKGAGPVMQKLIQGIPLNALPEELRPVVECSKSSLPPIPRDFVRAKLLDMVRQSGGRITSIEVKKSLGAATVGEALLCVVRTTDAPAGEECVIKMLRPDVPLRMQGDRDVLMKMVDEKDSGVANMLKARLAVIEEELDLTVEARNVELGRVYGFRAKEGPPLDVDSVSSHPLIGTTPGALALRKAPGATIDRFIAETNGKIEGVAARFRHVVFTDVTDPVTKKVTRKSRIVTSSKSVPEVVAAKLELRRLYQETFARHEMLIAFSKKWTEEAIFGKGVFHGDLHAGNIMADADRLTVIDYGNAFSLSEGDRNNLMGVTVSCFIGSESSFIDKVCALVPESSREEYRKRMKSFRNELATVLGKGSMMELPLRLMAAMRLMERNGLEIPAVLFNFSQSMSRLLATIDAVEDSLRRIRALAEDLGYDVSEYAKPENGAAPKDNTVGFVTALENPFDFTGGYPGLYKDFPATRPSLAVRQGYYPAPGAEDEYMRWEKFNKIVTERCTIGLKRNIQSDDFSRRIDGLLSSPEGYAQVKRWMIEVSQFAEGRLKDVSHDKVGLRDLSMEQKFADFESQPDPWNDPVARKDLGDGIWGVLHFMYTDSLPRNFALAMYPEFFEPKDYGNEFFDLVIHSVKDKGLIGRLGGGLLLDVSKFATLGASDALELLDAKETADNAVEKWLEGHPDLSRYDVARLKAVAKDLQVFNDRTFKKKGSLFWADHWSSDKGKRSEFLNGMAHNLEMIDRRFELLGLNVGGDELAALKKEFLMTYFMARSGVMAAFSNDPKKSGYERMTDADYRQLLAEAKELAGGKNDAPLVRVVELFRKTALANEKGG